MQLILLKFLENILIDFNIYLMKKIILILLLLFITIINAQVKDTIKIKSDILLGINLSGGNKPIYGGSIKSNLFIFNSNFETTISPSFSINYTPDSNGDVVLTRREFYNTLSISKKISNNFKLIGFSEVESSLVQKLNFRYNIGVGPGFKYYKNGNEISISEVFLLESLNSNIESIDDYSLIRLSTRLKIIVKTKFGSVSFINLIQPAIYTNQDIDVNKHMIFRSNNKIEFDINKNIKTGLTYDASYRSYTKYLVKTVKPFDWNTNFFIMYKI